MITVAGMYGLILMAMIALGVFPIHYRLSRKLIVLISAADIIIWILDYLVIQEKIALLGMFMPVIGLFSSIYELRRKETDIFHFRIPENSYAILQDVNAVVPGKTISKADTIIKWDGKIIRASQPFIGKGAEPIMLTCIQDKKTPNLFYCRTLNVIGGKKDWFITIIVTTSIIAALAIPYVGYWCVLENDTQGYYHQLTAGYSGVVICGFARFVLNTPDKRFVSRLRKLAMDIGWGLSILGLIFTLMGYT